MALKPTLNATEHAALPEALKAEYKIKSDGTFGIDLVGAFITDKDPQGLLSALESERNDHKITKSKFDIIVAERDDAKKAAQLAELQKAGNTEELKKFFETQQQQLRADFEAKEKAQQEQLQKQRQFAAESFRKTEIEKLATELFKENAPLLVPALLQKVNVKPSDFGLEPVLEFVGDNGQAIPGATISSFKEGLLTNPLFKGMITASKASGGSANEGKSNVPASTNSNGSVRTYKDYKPGELMAIKRSNPSLFNQLKQSHDSQSTS